MRYTRSQISKALLTAERLLKGPVHPAAKIAEVLNPYMDCTEVQGLSGQLQHDMKSSIFALMGDAYRREGNVQLAAHWYRRASAISAGSHAPIYAHMVCKHELADFYSDALTALEEHQRRWLAKPMVVRLFLQTMGRKPTDSDAQKSDLEFLRQHAVSKAA